MRVGLVGYSKQKFDQSKALELVSEAFDVVENLHEQTEGSQEFLKFHFGEVRVTHTLVSGLTDIGITAIGYREAQSRGAGWYLVGVACKKAKGYPCFPVHREIIVGDNWGDESTTFINSIDVLIRIGGGEQSKREIAMARALEILTIEYELEAIDD
jgi:hypothetical protein